MKRLDELRCTHLLASFRLRRKTDRDPPFAHQRRLRGELSSTIAFPSSLQNHHATRGRSFQFSTVLLAPQDAGIARRLPDKEEQLVLAVRNLSSNSRPPVCAIDSMISTPA